MSKKETIEAVNVRRPDFGSPAQPEMIDRMTTGEIIEVAASEGYPEGWWHCTIHLNPETGEMHSDGDHRVRTWIQDKLANASVRVGGTPYPARSVGREGEQ